MAKKIGVATNQVVEDFAFEATLEQQKELSAKEKRKALLCSYMSQGQEDARDGVSREDFYCDDKGIMAAYYVGYDDELRRRSEEKVTAVCEVSGAVLEVTVLKRA